jgi:hypothetical protein
LLALAGTPAALADVNDSSNWSGYAIHRGSVKFTKVSANWTQPTATCTAGHRSYSAFWVGLGGYNTTSNALEQIGTEVDCTSGGKVRSTAWYELVPAASRTIRLRVRPGDAIRATVRVAGQRVTLALYDGTAKRWFRKTLHTRTVDVSSAEWIAEAPSECFSGAPCQTLPLANFGSTTFSGALARSTSGHAGTISDRAWRWTQIRLTPGGRRFVVAAGSTPAAGAATPSALAANGSQFSVVYSSVSAQRTAFLRARQASLGAGHIVH